MDSKSILVQSLERYILKKFMEGSKIEQKDNSFKIGSVTIDASFNPMKVFKLFIEPTTEGKLIQSTILNDDDYFHLSTYFGSLYESQETSHLIDLVNSLE